jgi:UDP-N-acetylmuramoyl-tripeptide--D-alanyl-D-alanine ligase
MQFDLEDLASAVDGTLVGASAIVDGVDIDSRRLRPGSLFVALVAERDGHDYLEAAEEAGASAALVTDADRVPDGMSAVVVDDAEDALARLGSLARTRMDDRVVAVTGSVGKTSVKDLASAAIGAGLAVHASERSFNNEIGVPLTLANTPEGTEAVVVEMGARGAGHIADLCAIAQPTVGVVTAVAQAHTELFGTIDDVARAKGELVEALPKSGIAVLNADDHRVAAMTERCAARVLTYGVDAGAVRAMDIVLDDELRPSFTLETPWGRAPVRLAARGVHNAANAAGAAAAALALRVPLDAVVEGLHDAVLSPWRMEVTTAPSGAVIINDAYNANPASAGAALDALIALPADRHIAVLGVMAELGDGSEAEHRAIGDLAREHGVELIAVDAPAYGGVDVADAEQAADRLAGIGRESAVLVKGSRVAGLERLAQKLTAGD